MFRTVTALGPVRRRGAEGWKMVEVALPPHPPRRRHRCLTENSGGSGYSPPAQRITDSLRRAQAGGRRRRRLSRAAGRSSDSRGVAVESPARSVLGPRFRVGCSGGFRRAHQSRKRNQRVRVLCWDLGPWGRRRFELVRNAVNSAGRWAAPAFALAAGDSDLLPTASARAPARRGPCLAVRVRAAVSAPPTAAGSGTPRHGQG